MLTTVLAAKLLYEATSYTGSEPVHQPWAQNTMEFTAWNDQQWVAWVHDGAFEQIPQDKKNWSRHSNVTLAFTDWEGEMWQAKIDGDAFLLAHRGDWKGLVERTEAIRYRDWTGTNQLRTLAQLRR